ncbi:MAG TPA: DUF3472 domain-containing protein [Gemmatimonadales bacterium]|jgi:hypothetical protein
MPNLMLLFSALLGLAGLPGRRVPVRIPAFTAYISPDPSGADVSEAHGVTNWHPGQAVVWYGQFSHAGPMTISASFLLPRGDSLLFHMGVRENGAGARIYTGVAHGTGAETTVILGTYIVQNPGTVDFNLLPADTAALGRAITALILDGPAADAAHFNLKPRRNAASVHLRFPTDSGLPITGFYTEVTAVTDPTTTYYMATGFARGYFGMQVNSPTERRIIFSVWDAAEGRSAVDRSTVAADNQTHLLAKGAGVEASVFGNEGTGGHSHLVYNWKTGSTQRFYVTAKPEGTATIYTGYWFQPDQQKWLLIASFRAPKDGGWLRSLYSFSEDFGDETGNLVRKALYGPQWIKLADGSWRELTTATFSTDATGKADRLDRFMGVEGNRFFLSHGGFGPGFTAYGTAFTRPATGTPPVIELP